MFLRGVLSEEKTNKLVKKELINQGFTNDVTIKKIVDDGGSIIYHIYDYIRYKDKVTKVLTVISCSDYMKLLRRALQKKQINVSELKPDIKQKVLSYHMAYDTNNKKE